MKKRNVFVYFGGCFGVCLAVLLGMTSVVFAEQPPEKRRQLLEEQELASVRASRPVSLAVDGLGKTPLVGVTADINLHPYFGLGIGYGYFSLANVTGSFIPVYLQGYLLKSNFSPYVEAGIDFVTVNFNDGSGFFDGSFQGTQFILGAGLEYRFDFGLLLRLDVVRFVEAGVFVPGLAIGYSVLVL